ncbi:hypothetical protein A1O3_04734 [Capronia epimyces CBS 606.96]|uniref:Major facilitator superfamily (MFS) profile domain-containing protein n=1 Tax=Capronia epimyces CBS 606.96 TaxID=1182542 RepID=W9XU33_9EURO|nr:uncharacterized protein A1O3_04734 [Capronia epimyces CBS 606.96]EXJ84067.1 hypothetical protein A1O3_04734 [Capronia epimyces CBS 606.96]
MARVTLYNKLIVAFVALGSYSYGYSYAVFGTSIGMPGFFLYFDLDPDSSYTAGIIGTVNSLFAAGAAFGAIFQGWLADWIGRKNSFAVAALSSLVGSALFAGSVDVPMLVVCRFINGFGLGILLSLVPLYIAEVAPPRHRGAMASFTAVGFAGGYFISAWVGYACYFAKSLTVQWRLPLALAVVGPIFVMAGVWWLPESPRYLSWKNRNDEAWEIIRKIHHDPEDAHDSAARAEYIQIVKQVEFDKTISSGYIDMFRRPSWRKRSLLTIFLIFAMQSAGILGITNYVVLICQSLDLTGSMPLLMYALYVVVAVSGNCFNQFAIDRLGRRKMFLIGLPVTGGCLLAEALLQRQYVGTDHKAGLGAALFFVFLFGICYGFFLDPTQFVWCSEVFPTTLRAKGLGLCFFTYFIGAITYTTPAPTAFKNIGWKYYLVWVACDVVSVVLVYFFLPETAGLSLEEVGQLFGDTVVVHLTKDGHGLVEMDQLDKYDDKTPTETREIERVEGEGELHSIPKQSA